MIPSLPETISATHVEYLPLSAACFKSFIGKSISPTNENILNGKSTSIGQKLTKQDVATVRALRALQQFIPLNTSAVPTNVYLNYFRGNDLYYAPHVRVPVAESIENY